MKHAIVSFLRQVRRDTIEEVGETATNCVPLHSWHATRKQANFMANIAVLYCKKIKDHSCIACAKCFKGMTEKNGEYARHDTIELVAMTDCGDCPGLTVPRVKLLTELTGNLQRPIDVIHLGTCVKLAMETAQCPIEYDDLKVTLEKKFGVQVVLGTHTY